MISKDNNSIAPLDGLVLAGGKSRRMGTDKSTLQWHGREQRYYVADLLKGICNDVFISCRPEQQSGLDTAYNTLTDTYTDKGPYGAILTALQAQPRSAWLVIACDLPLLDMITLQYLVAHRDITKIATTFKSPFDGLPEPLITIWEPAAQPVLLSFLSAGFSCPRKVLIRNEHIVKVITAPGEDALLNTNTPEDAEKAKAILLQRK